MRIGTENEISFFRVSKSKRNRIATAGRIHHKELFAVLHGSSTFIILMSIKESVILRRSTLISMYVVPETAVAVPVNAQ